MGTTQKATQGVGGTTMRPPLGPSWSSIATAVQASLGVTALVLTLGIPLSLWAANITGSWAETPSSFDAGQRATMDGLMVMQAVAVWGGLFVTGVLFIAWLYSLHASSIMDTKHFERQSLWVIVGWFVPIVNWWFPYSVVQDTHRWLTPRPHHGPGRRLVGGLPRLLVRNGDERGHPSGDRPRGCRTFREHRTSYLGETVTAPTGVVAAVAAIVMVRHLTKLARAKVTTAEDAAGPVASRHTHP